MHKNKTSDKDKILLKCNQREMKLILNSINESCKRTNKDFGALLFNGE